MVIYFSDTEWVLNELLSGFFVFVCVCLNFPVTGEPSPHIPLSLSKHAARGLMHSAPDLSLLLLIPHLWEFHSSSSSCSTSHHLISRYPAKAYQYHIEPQLTLLDPSSSSPSAAQQRSWVGMRTHTHNNTSTSTLKTGVLGGNVPRAGSEVTSEPRWKSRELMVGDTPCGCTWLYPFLFWCCYFYFQSVYLKLCVCFCVSSLLTTGSDF